MEMVVEPVTLVSCAGTDHICSMAESCNVIGPMKNLNSKMRHFFRTISIKELLEIEEDAVKEEVN
jgi:DNA-binding IscR family transcriptional regulator